MIDVCVSKDCSLTRDGVLKFLDDVDVLEGGLVAL